MAKPPPKTFDQIKNWFRYSPGERNVISVLLVILIAVITIPYYFPKPDPPIENLDQLKAEMELLQQEIAAQQLAREQAYANKYPRTAWTPKTWTQKERPADPEPFVFDPNTLDSSGFLQLGFSPKQTAVILKYRNKGVFRSVDDFNKLFVVSDKMKEKLASFIQINEIVPKKTEPIKTHTIELNTADTSQLIQLRGIGSYYAMRIVEYRQRLGGFYHTKQLLEIKGIDADRFALFASQIKIDTSHIRKIKINQVSEFELRKHPYIPPHLAKNILTYRNFKKTISDIDELVSSKILLPIQREQLEMYFKY